MAQAPKTRNTDPPPPPETQRTDPRYLHGKDPSWDIVDQASWDSFPASDPPGYIAGQDVPPEDDT